MIASLRTPRYPLTQSLVERAMNAAYRILKSTVLGSSLDHDSTAQIARAYAHLHNAGHPTVSAADVTSVLDTLWTNRYTNSTTSDPGFGLSYAWDAFQDGTTNKSTTIYSYTTAQAALAFLDGYIVSGDRTYLSHAEDCATTVLTDCWGYSNVSELGAWYSDQAADQGAGSSSCVYNPNGLFLAVLNRLFRINGTAFSATKETGIKALLNDNEQTGGWWQYSVAGGTDNLGHHCLIVEGLAWQAMASLSDALTYIWATSGWVYSDGCIALGSTDADGSILNGMPFALMTLLLDASTAADADLVARALVPSIGQDGTPAYALTASTLGSEQQRSYANYALGLARYAAYHWGDGSLFP